MPVSFFIKWQTKKETMQPERCLFPADYGCRFLSNNMNAILQSVKRYLLIGD